MKRQTVQEFCDEGQRLFGKRGRDWTFRCPACGGEQTPLNFVTLGVPREEAVNRAAFHCIGRLHRANRGCDWTLGGLLQIHTLEVTEGELTQRCFEFATPENKRPAGVKPISKTVRHHSISTDATSTQETR